MLITLRHFNIHIIYSLNCKTFLHQLEELRVIHLLLGHMIEHISPLIDWHISLTSSLDLVYKWLNSLVDIQFVIIEEEWILSVVL